MMKRDPSIERMSSLDSQDTDFTKYLLGGIGRERNISDPADTLQESQIRRGHRLHMKAYFKPT